MRFKPSDHVKLAILLCVTIGLTPFFPPDFAVPHSYEKLKWLLEGGIGMEGLDYFDLVIHNLPWLYLVFATIYWYRKKEKKEIYS